MKLAIVGSRNYTDYETFKSAVSRVVEKEDITHVISGGASGVDKLAEKWAKDNNIQLIVFTANWKKYGKGAGPLRNTQIVEECDYMIAFPSKSGRGTQDSIRKAEKLKRLLSVFYIEEL